MSGAPDASWTFYTQVCVMQKKNNNSIIDKQLVDKGMYL